MLMLLSGCGGHQQSVIDPAGSQAGLIVQLWWFFLWLLGVIFVLVVAVMLWALTRRHAVSSRSRWSGPTFLLLKPSDG